MKSEEYKKLSPEGQILANELMEIKKIVIELRDGVNVIEAEGQEPVKVDAKL